MLGFFSRKYMLIERLRENTILVTFALILFISAFVTIEYFGYTQGRYNKIAGFSMLIFLIYIFSNRENASSFIENKLEFIGRNTLEIYIFHYFLLFNLNVVFIQDWAIATHNGLLELLFVAFISIIITYISIGIGWIFHQEKWLQRIIYGG